MMTRQMMADNKSNGSDNEKAKSDDENVSNSDNSSEKISSQLSTKDTTLNSNESTDSSSSAGESGSDELENGKVYTGNSNKIIGNARTRKYHVPGQAGYNMNSEKQCILILKRKFKLQDLSDQKGSYYDCYILNVIASSLEVYWLLCDHKNWVCLMAYPFLHTGEFRNKR